MLCKQINQYAYEKYVKINEEEKSVYYILSEKHSKNCIEIVNKIVKEKGFKGKKIEQGIEFEKDGEKIMMKIGKNAENEMIMTLGFECGNDSWKELGLTIGKMCVQNEVLYIYGQL